MKGKLTTLVLAMATWGLFSLYGFSATTIPSRTALPATITFTGTNPQSTPTVSGNSSSTITFTTTGGSNARNWQVQVQSTSGNFGACPDTLSASLVRVTCTGASVAGGGGTGSCGGAFNLSTALQTVASGVEGTGTSRSYTVTLSFTFTDSWGYIATASPCTLGLSYRITAN